MSTLLSIKKEETKARARNTLHFMSLTRQEKESHSQDQRLEWMAVRQEVNGPAGNGQVLLKFLLNAKLFKDLQSQQSDEIEKNQKTN
jgi:hypothetical protein